MDSDYEDTYLKFEQTEDGRVLLVGEWQPEVVFSDQLLEAAFPKYVMVVGTEIHLKLDNAEAQYHITEHDDAEETVHAVLVKGLKLKIEI